LRLLSYRQGPTERLGVAVGERALPATALLPGGPATIGDLFAGGEVALEALRAACATGAERIRAEGMALADLHLLAPVPRPGKVVAIGLNYYAHAAEQKVEPPKAPLIFAKFPTAVIGPGEAIAWDPALTAQVDYEAELAVVIGRRVRNVGVAEALDFVLGYTCANDVSARDLQFGDRQWVRGKSLDTFCPLGPVVVTADEIPDPGTLAIACDVSGVRLQSSNTADLIFSVAVIIAHCSRAFTLEPGDVILTGTPSGVGIFRDPPRFLHDGDEVAVEIERIGRLVNPCREVAAGT
jgi:2-keto-4-pentenoate hydratase/2-oxohepta-3-ene-1,7-dioic acid hydratase in catechol pathway